MISKIVSALAILIFSAPAFSQGGKSGFDAWSIVMGDWAGAGSGKPGEGTGSFSFKLDLQGKILARKAHSEYPASQGRPAVVHDDLMVVYIENDRTRAIYFDNEGHTIRYTSTFSSDGKTLTMVSDPVANSPTFRLTYIATKPDVLTINFEIAPPTSDTFKTYVSGTANRVK